MHKGKSTRFFVRTLAWPAFTIVFAFLLMGVADAMGYSLLAQDAGKAQEFAADAALALDRSRITVDLPGQVVGY